MRLWIILLILLLGVSSGLLGCASGPASTPTSTTTPTQIKGSDCARYLKVIELRKEEGTNNLYGRVQNISTQRIDGGFLIVYLLDANNQPIADTIFPIPELEPNYIKEYTMPTTCGSPPEWTGEVKWEWDYLDLPASQ